MGLFPQCPLFQRGQGYAASGKAERIVPGFISLRLLRRPFSTNGHGGWAQYDANRNGHHQQTQRRPENALDGALHPSSSSS